MTRLPRYPGEVEIRYVKKPRSVQDSTICYFRQEWDGGAIPVLRSEHEIAEKVEGEQLTILAVDQSRFRLIASFAPRWSGEATRAGTRQFVTVSLLNKRRD